MPKDDTKDLDATTDIEKALLSFIQTAEGLGIPLTADEIEEKRAELEGIASGTPAVNERGDYNSFEEAMAAAGTDVAAIDDFQRVEKASLVNVPFIITKWRFADGDMGGFVVCRIITQDNRKLFITDGSTGIYEQLKSISLKTGKTEFLVCRSGLSVSEYTKETSEGIKQAKTFYLQ